VTTETEQTTTPEQSKEQIDAQAEKDFESGFNQDREQSPSEVKPEVRSEAKPEAQPEAQPEAKPEDKPDAPPAEVDPWDGVSPILREKLEAQERFLSQITGQLGDLGKLTHEVKTQSGRIAAIQREQAAAKAAVRDVSEAPTKAQIDEAKATPEKWTRLKGDFPEWADALDERFAAERADMIKLVKPVDVAGITQEVTTTFADAIKSAEARARATAIAEARELARIDSRHEGWEETINSKEFIEWSYSGGPSPEERARYFALKRTAPDQAAAFFANFARTHPKWWGDRGALMDSDKSRDAIKLLDEYAEHSKSRVTQQKKQEKLRAAVPAKGTSPAAPSDTNEEDAFLAGFGGRAA